MAKRTVRAASKNSPAEDERKLFAILAVAIPLIGYLVAILAKRDDAYVRFYGKQGIVLFVACVIVWVAGWILAFVAFIGWIVHWALLLALFVLWVCGILYSLSGEEKPLPIIGTFAGRF